MKIIALLPVRNEEWIIHYSLPLLLQWVDEAIVLNHASTDGTGDILIDIAAKTRRVLVLNEPNPTWLQYEYRQRLLELGRERGGTYFTFTDGDEVLTANLLPVVRGRIESLQPGECLTLPMLCMWRDPMRYRSGKHHYSSSQLTFAVADSPNILWRSDDGFEHSHRQPYGISQFVHWAPSSGGVMHYEWCDWRRLTAKTALYKMRFSALPPRRMSNREIEQSVSTVVDEAGLETSPVPLEWTRGYDLSQIRLGLPPWQVAECRRFAAAYPPETFVGLDLYGTV